MDDNRCSPMILRNSKDGNRLNHSTVLDEAGWHFSYLGGIDEIVKKVKSFSHEEFDTTEFLDENVLKKRLLEGDDIFGRPGYPHIRYIDLDDSFPKYLLKNKSKYEHLINEVTS